MRHQVAVSADDVNPRIPVGLRVNEQHGFPDRSLHGMFTSQCADLPFKTIYVGVSVFMTASTSFIAAVG